jgi:hypothetical protein
MMDGQALTFEDSTFDAAFSILSTTCFPLGARGWIKLCESCGQADG